MGRHDASSGFTLIETLVALIIFVACYLLIQQTVALGWRGIQVAHAEAAAVRLAQNRLAGAGVDAPLQDGQQTGQTADGYDWSMQIQRYAQPDFDGPSQRLAGYWVTRGGDLEGRPSAAETVAAALHPQADGIAMIRRALRARSTQTRPAWLHVDRGAGFSRPPGARARLALRRRPLCARHVGRGSAA